MIKLTEYSILDTSVLAYVELKEDRNWILDTCIRYYYLRAVTVGGSDFIIQCEDKEDARRKLYDIQEQMELRV